MRTAHPAPRRTRWHAARIALPACALAVLTALVGCSDPENPKNLSGTIYCTFAGSARYYDLNQGKYVDQMMRMGSSTSRFDSFDISWDGRKILLAMDVERSFNFDERRLVVRDKADGITYKDVNTQKNAVDVTFEWGDIKSVFGRLSPNEQYVAVAAQHFSGLPTSIVSLKDQKIIASWKVDGVSLLQYGRPVWAKDNQVYFQIKTSLYRAGPADGYQRAEKLLSFEDDTDYVQVNPQGTQVVFRQADHLWLANIDGTQLRQITTSKVRNPTYGGERRPTFSPDGKYIAFTADGTAGARWSDHDYPDKSWVSAAGSEFGYLAIIPANGKLYDLDDKKSGAIWLQQSEKRPTGIPCQQSLIWR